MRDAIFVSIVTRYQRRVFWDSDDVLRQIEGLELRVVVFRSMNPPT